MRLRWRSKHDHTHTHTHTLTSNIHALKHVGNSHLGIKFRCGQQVANKHSVWSGGGIATTTADINWPLSLIIGNPIYCMRSQHEAYKQIKVADYFQLTHIYIGIERHRVVHQNKKNHKAIIAHYRRRSSHYYCCLCLCLCCTCVCVNGIY